MVFFLSLLVHSRAKIAEMLIWSQKGLTMSFSFCFFRICCCVVYLSRHVKRIALNCVFFFPDLVDLHLDLNDDLSYLSCFVL